MVIKTCIILWISFVCVTEGAKVGQNDRIIKTRLNALESRLNYQSNYLFDLQESIDQMNKSFSWDKECQQICPIREETISFDAEIEERDKFENDNNILFKAFKKGKAWTHAEIEEQTHQLNALNFLFKGLKSALENSKENISERFETLQSHLESEVTKRIQIVTAQVKYDFEKLSSERNETKMLMAKVEDDASTLKKNLDKIKEQLVNYSLTFNEFKSKMNGEILDIKKQLAAGPSCPPNWSQFLGYCYHLNSKKVNINTAVKLCSDSSAYVVEIESEVEFQFLKSINDRYIWIGISDRKEEGSWKQIRNDQQMKFSNWAPGQPQDFNVYDEDCAVMYPDSGLWHDYKCNNTFEFICKKMVVF